MGAPYARAIEDSEDCRMSAASYLDSALVIDNRGDAVASREFDLFFRRADIVVETVTFEQSEDHPLLYKGEDFARTDVESVSPILP